MKLIHAPSIGVCKDVCARDPNCVSVACSPLKNGVRVNAIYAKDNAVLDFTNGRKSFCKYQSTKHFLSESL